MPLTRIHMERRHQLGMWYVAKQTTVQSNCRVEALCLLSTHTNEGSNKSQINLYVLASHKRPFAMHPVRTVVWMPHSPEPHTHPCVYLKQQTDQRGRHCVTQHTNPPQTTQDSKHATQCDSLGAVLQVLTGPCGIQQMLA
jgi:hypothetical protein